MIQPRILVTISRSWSDYTTCRDVLGKVHARHPEAVLVHGDAARGDRYLAAVWTRMGGTVEAHPAAWDRCIPECPAWHRKLDYCRDAGFRRNAQMVESNPDLVVAFIRDQSAGASHCADLAEGAGLTVVRYTQEVEA